ncbi:MAG: hypothetical protein AAF762_08920 [Pseudomonadota bacterium]
MDTPLFSFRKYGGSLSVETLGATVDMNDAEVPVVDDTETEPDRLPPLLLTNPVNILGDGREETEARAVPANKAEGEEHSSETPPLALDADTFEFVAADGTSSLRNETFGGDDDDLLQGIKGRNLMQGGAGNDTMNGGTADDTLRGDDGHDALGGGAGNDTLEGGNGAHYLVGGDGGDSLYGDVMVPTEFIY